MNPALQGYAAAIVGEGADVAVVAEELRAVDALVADNSTLFVALTDTSVPGPARRAVVRDLLSSRVSEPVVRAAAYVAGSLAATDVPAGLSWLATRARLAAAGEASSEPPLGHLEARARVAGFAAAVFEPLATGELEEVEDELFRFSRTVAATPALRAALSDRDLPVPVRQDVVHQLVADKVRPATLRLIDYAISGGRPRDLVGTLAFLVEETAKARGWRVARVRAAQSVDGEERDHLTSSLSQVTGTPVELQVTLDPDLLAGVVVEVGDLRVEASARGRLDRLREHMATGGWEDHGYGGGPTTDAERN